MAIPASMTPAVTLLSLPLPFSGPLLVEFLKRIPPRLSVPGSEPSPRRLERSLDIDAGVFGGAKDELATGPATNRKRLTCPESQLPTECRRDDDLTLGT